MTSRGRRGPQEGQGAVAPEEAPWPLKKALTTGPCARRQPTPCRQKQLSG